MWESHALRTGSKEGFDSGVSWDQDFTLNERESERPIIKVPDKQGREPNHEGEKHPPEYLIELGGNSPIFYSLTRFGGQRRARSSCLQLRTGRTGFDSSN